MEVLLTSEQFALSVGAWVLTVGGVAVYAFKKGKEVGEEN